VLPNFITSWQDVAKWYQRQLRVAHYELDNVVHQHVLQKR